MGANIWQSFRRITKCAFQVLGSARSRVGTGCQFFLFQTLPSLKRETVLYTKKKSHLSARFNSQLPKSKYKKTTKTITGRDWLPPLGENLTGAKAIKEINSRKNKASRL